MVKRYHESFPSFSYEFDSRYPLQPLPKNPTCDSLPHGQQPLASYLRPIRKPQRIASMFKGLFLSLALIVGGLIIGVPVVFALLV